VYNDTVKEKKYFNFSDSCIGCDIEPYHVIVLKLLSATVVLNTPGRKDNRSFYGNMNFLTYNFLATAVLVVRMFSANSLPMMVEGSPVDHLEFEERPIDQIAEIPKLGRREFNCSRKIRQPVMWMEEIRNDIRKLSDQLNTRDSERSLAVNFPEGEKELRSLKKQLEKCEQRKPKAEREVTMEQLVTGKDPSLVSSGSSRLSLVYKEHIR